MTLSVIRYRYDWLQQLHRSCILLPPKAIRRACRMLHQIVALVLLLPCPSPICSLSFFSLKNQQPLLSISITSLEWSSCFFDHQSGSLSFDLSAHNFYHLLLLFSPIRSSKLIFSINIFHCSFPTFSLTRVTLNWINEWIYSLDKKIRQSVMH